MANVLWYVGGAALAERSIVLSVTQTANTLERIVATLASRIAVEYVSAGLRS